MANTNYIQLVQVIVLLFIGPLWPLSTSDMCQRGLVLWSWFFRYSGWRGRFWQQSPIIHQTRNTFKELKDHYPWKEWTTAILFSKLKWNMNIIWTNFNTLYELPINNSWKPWTWKSNSTPKVNNEGDGGSPCLTSLLYMKPRHMFSITYTISVK